MPGSRRSPAPPDAPPEGGVNGDGEQTGDENPDGVQVFASVVEMQPPVRARTTKQTLTADQLRAFASAVIEKQKWAGTGETFTGTDPEEAHKVAGNTARVWRRELARFLGCAERDIRTRVWETGDPGVYTCAIKLRDGSKVTMPADDAGTDTDDDAGDDAGDDDADGADDDTGDAS